MGRSIKSLNLTQTILCWVNVMRTKKTFTAITKEHKGIHVSWRHCLQVACYAEGHYLHKSFSWEIYLTTVCRLRFVGFDDTRHIDYKRIQQIKTPPTSRNIQFIDVCQSRLFWHLTCSRSSFLGSPVAQTL